jgi:hypothetical protein
MNTNVFSGSDATISFAVEAGLAGDAAKHLIDGYQLSPISRAVNLQIAVTSDLKPYHEQGQLYPTEIRSGNVTISGTIERAYLNGAFVKLLLGDAATSRPAGAWVQPTFSIIVGLSNAAFPGSGSRLYVHGVKFQKWFFSVSEDGFVMENVEFLGTWITVEDEGGR